MKIKTINAINSLQDSLEVEIPKQQELMITPTAQQMLTLMVSIHGLITLIKEEEGC